MTSPPFSKLRKSSRSKDGFALAGLIIGIIALALSVCAVWVISLLQAHGAIEESIEAQWIVWVLAAVVASFVVAIYTAILQFIVIIGGLIFALVAR